MRVRLRTPQKDCSERRGARAERQRGGDAASVADSTGGDDRQVDMIREPRHERHETDGLPFRSRLIERAAMSAGFVPLRDDRVRAGVARDSRLGERRRRREPRDPARLQPADERGGIHAHDGRHSRGRRLEKRLALRIEVRQMHVAGRRRHGRTPSREKCPDARFSVSVSCRRRIPNPEVELKRAAAVRPRAAPSTRPSRPSLRRSRPRWRGLPDTRRPSARA